MKRWVGMLGWAGFFGVTSALLLFRSGDRECVGSDLPTESGLPEPALNSLLLDPGPPSGTRVRVEVLNAGGVAGLASDATDYLRELGFDVVSFGNAIEFTEEGTRVLDRAGDSAMAGSVARALGVRDFEIAPDPELYLDVTVLLGAEWLRPGQPPLEPEARWWDVRRWFRQRRNRQPVGEASQGSARGTLRSPWAACPLSS